MGRITRFSAISIAIAAAAMAPGSVRAATVVGWVLDEHGATPPGAQVVALSAEDWRTLASTQTLTGRFALDVADGSEVYLVAVASSGETLDGYRLHGYTLGLERLSVSHGLVTRDIRVRTCHELILEGRRADGALLRLEDLPPGSAAVDALGEGVVDGLITVDGDNGRTGLPALCVPVGEAYRLYLRYDLPGAGRLNLPFDRDGAPFASTGQGAEILDLNETLARSQLARLDRLAGAIVAAGGEPPQELRSDALWQDLHAASALGPGERGPRLDAVAAEAVVTLESLRLWQADRDAELYRTGRLDLVVLDAAGAPAPGLTVEYRQLGHDFGFGVFEPYAEAGQGVYDRLDQAGLNAVTAGYFWKQISPAPGVVDWDFIDSYVGVSALSGDGWQVKGHPLTWFSPLAMPSYLDGLSPGELAQLSADHVFSIVDHYRGRVDLWDVANEAAGVAGSGGLTRAEMDAYLSAVFSAARAANPSSRLVLNNHFDPFGHARIDERLAGVEAPFTLSIPGFVRRCLDLGVDFDIIGQQLYNGGAISRLAELGIGSVEGVPTYDLGFVSDFLDELAATGRPVHITEHSVPSAWDDTSEQAAAGYWRDRWSEEVQAAYMDAIVRLAFGHPAVHSITWWNALDGQALIRHGGIIRPDGSPKPALGVLADRIAGWTSAGVVATDDAGRARVSGFAGAYELTITVGDTVHRYEAHISERSLARLTVVVDSLGVRPVRRAGGRQAP
ncbi:MAG: endo-1,4-beta-xylanase [Thermoanaerobaculales bacterium]|jgi:GH35 family endo-1,4-beta-xylanase|nr:endo-1,4-beta-xylanase [Thermoanaerobaculales bacterium]